MQKKLINILLIIVGVLLMPSVINAANACSYGALTGGLSDYNTGVNFQVSRGSNNTIKFSLLNGDGSIAYSIEKPIQDDGFKNEKNPADYYFQLGKTLITSDTRIWLLPNNALASAIDSGNCPTLYATFNQNEFIIGNVINYVLKVSTSKPDKAVNYGTFVSTGSTKLTTITFSCTDENANFITQHISKMSYDKNNYTLNISVDGKTSSLNLKTNLPEYISVDGSDGKRYRIKPYKSSNLLKYLSKGGTSVTLSIYNNTELNEGEVREIYIINKDALSDYYRDIEGLADQEANNKSIIDNKKMKQYGNDGTDSSANNYEELVFCEQEGVLKTLNILGWLLYFLKIAVPGVLIVMCVIDFATAVTKSDEKALTTAMTTSTRRVIAAVAIFLVPSITYVIINLIGNSVSDDDSFKACNECLLKPSKCNVSTINYKEPENSSSGKISKYQECIDKQCVYVPDGEQRENCKKQCKANNPE